MVKHENVVKQVDVLINLMFEAGSDIEDVVYDLIDTYVDNTLEKLEAVQKATEKLKEIEEVLCLKKD